LWRYAQRRNNGPAGRNAIARLRGRPGAKSLAHRSPRRPSSGTVLTREQGKASSTGALFLSRHSARALSRVLRRQADYVLGGNIERIVEDNTSNPTEAVATAVKLIKKD
jgi:hypothetical protein